MAPTTPRRSQRVAARQPPKIPLKPRKLRSVSGSLSAGLNSLKLGQNTVDTSPSHRVQKNYSQKSSKTNSPVMDTSDGWCHQPYVVKEYEEGSNEWGEPTNAPDPSHAVKEPEEEKEVELTPDIKATFEPSFYCRVPNEIASDVLQRGHDSISRTLFHAFQRECPADCFQLWDDPTHVNWGRRDMYRLMESTPILSIFNEHGTVGHQCLMDVVELRNAYAHPAWITDSDFTRSTKNIHTWLGYGLKLAELLNDSSEAESIRKAREELLAAAVGTWNEVQRISKACSKGAVGPFKPSKALLRTFESTTLPRTKDGPQRTGYMKRHDKQELTHDEYQLLEQAIRQQAKDAVRKVRPDW